MENITEKAGQTLLDDSIPFSLKVKKRFKRFWWQKLQTTETVENYVITPLKYGTLIAISTIISTIPDWNKEDSLLKIALSSPELYEKICRVIAFGILNDKLAIKAEKESNELTDKIVWALEPEEGLKLYMAIVGKMDVQSFFFTINLIKGNNILMKDIKVENQFGEQSAPQSKNTT